MNFWRVVQGGRWSQGYKDKVDVWISFEFPLLSSLGHVSWSGAGCSKKGRVAGERSNCGNIQVRGRAVEAETKSIRACLSIHNAGESRHLLLNRWTPWYHCVNVSHLPGI